jgi:virginiamycin B lyase
VGRRVTLLSALLVIAALFGAGAANANPHLAGVFDLRGQPGHMARGPDGNIWVNLTLNTNDKTLARIEPDGTVTRYGPTELGMGDNNAGISAGPDHNLWITKKNFGVVRVPPADPSSAKEFAIPAITDARGITQGPLGRMWAASADQFISFDPANPLGFSNVTIDGMGARGIDASGGRLWIADFAGQRIVRVGPAGVKFFNVGGGPQETARGPEKSIAYANPGGDPESVGRIKPGKGFKVTDTPNADPFGLTFAEDNRWWIAEFAKSKMGLLSPNGDFKQFDLPDNSGPRNVARGPAGSHTLWVGLETSHQVARIKGVG